jgi:hypothetical protein
MKPTIQTLSTKGWKSVDDFYAHCINVSTPTLFRNAASEWRAVSKWNDPKYLSGKIGLNKQVPISLGGCEETTSGNTKSRKINMLFERFIALLHEGDCNGYLKQYDLSQSPLLREDVMPEKLFQKWSFGVCYLWIGSEGSSKTGLHNDDENNVLCQITGQKQVLLISPNERSNLYPNDLYDSGTECCDVSASSPNFDLHPLFKGVSTIFSVTLNPGDILFIPKYWYHQVRPLGSVSISVNYFNSSMIELIQFGIGRFCLDILHRAGCYRKGHCVCHNNR